jgi:hypothetical protein
LEHIAREIECTLVVVMDDLEGLMGERLQTHLDSVERLKNGDPRALLDLLAACTGAIVRSVEVKILR